VSKEIATWSDTLSIEPVGEGSRASRMSISAYRFRRTKGTSMVLCGHSPEEVAEALDHQSTSAVRHYFNFNRDLIDFVNSAHSASEEITEAVAFWSGRLASPEAKLAAQDSRVAHLGICKLGAPCPHHPTVT